MDEGAGPWETSRALVEAALEAGGPDNITAVVASIDPVTP
jgi:serine/threonine protein phosphatase PrpC